MLKSVAIPLFMRKTAVDNPVENLWIKGGVVHIIHRAKNWKNVGVDNSEVMHMLSTGKTLVIHRKNTSYPQKNGVCPQHFVDNFFAA